MSWARVEIWETRIMYSSTLCWLTIIQSLYERDVFQKASTMKVSAYLRNTIKQCKKQFLESQCNTLIYFFTYLKILMFLYLKHTCYCITLFYPGCLFKKFKTFSLCWGRKAAEPSGKPMKSFNTLENPLIQIKAKTECRCPGHDMYTIMSNFCINHKTSQIKTVMSWMPYHCVAYLQVCFLTHVLNSCQNYSPTNFNSSREWQPFLMFFFKTTLGAINQHWTPLNLLK